MIPAHFCPQCGTAVTGDAGVCVQCGTPVPMIGTTCDTDNPRQERARLLLEEAQHHYDQNELDAARAVAHSALTLHPDCPAIHSLLGCIHQRLGHDAAARLHFQAALAVEPASTTPVATPATPSRPPAASAWMSVIVVGCILFSGLATLFTFLPTAQKAQQAALLAPKPLARPLQPSPDFPLRITVPRPLPNPDPVGTPRVDHPVETVTLRVDTPAVVEAPPPPPSGTILGPAAHGDAAVPVREPTLDQADEAYFRGEYDRAATLYEALLRRGDTTNPRLHQDLAWCYQRLGNAGKAIQHLREAQRGYQKQLEDDPQNTAAQHGIDACQAALHAESTRDTP